MIRFNGVKVKTPSEYQVSNMDLVEGETRNARGNAFAEKIATKIKIELTWDYLTKQEMNNIVNTLTNSFFFEVEFIDLDGVKKLRKFYPGDRTGGVLDFKNNVVRWKDFKFNIIQQ